MESAEQSQTLVRSLSTSIVIGFSAPGTDALAMTRELGATGEVKSGVCFGLMDMMGSVRHWRLTDVVGVKAAAVVVSRP
jgi:hypothetical protein